MISREDAIAMAPLLPTPPSTAQVVVSQAYYFHFLRRPSNAGFYCESNICAVHDDDRTLELQ